MCKKSNQKLKLEDIISSLVKQEVKCALENYYENILSNVSISGGAR